jgi:predicted RNA-binding Zn-ribbon protein involved in translation (DUF1610 family)
MSLAECNRCGTEVVTLGDGVYGVNEDGDTDFKWTCPNCGYEQWLTDDQLIDLITDDDVDDGLESVGDE